METAYQAKSSDPDEEIQHTVSGICPNGMWDVSVRAINEYGGIGLISNIVTIEIVDRKCEDGKLIVFSTYGKLITHFFFTWYNSISH